MIKLYNSLSRKKEDLNPLNPPKISMYACGLTPQNHPHLGHAVAAIRFTIIRQYLKYRGYEVTFVENLTDIDDKIINKSIELGIQPREVSNIYIKEYHKALEDLELPKPDYNPRVSDFIIEIIKYITELIDLDYAYTTQEGDVYFNVSRKTDYGKLSGRVTTELQSGVRVQVESNKINSEDFALWKIDDTEGASWESPWGKGRPGWHIECSVMSNQLLGNTIDIHCGGLDLIFPHHENEIAQCEAHNNTKFVNYWVHCGLLEIDGKKMSKSLNNFITIDEALNKYGKELIHFVILRHHYRSAIDFNDKLFRDNLNSLTDYYWVINEDIWNNTGSDLTNDIDLSKQLISEFEKAMDNDFNTPVALTVLSAYLKKSKELISSNNIAEGLILQKTILKLGRIIGLFSLKYSKKQLLDECLRFYQNSINASEIVSLENLNALLLERENAKTTKDYGKSDSIRERLKLLGVTPMDGNASQTWCF